MDMMSMVSGLLAAQAGNVQTQVAATILKSNADAEKSTVLTLLGAAQQSIRRWPMSAPVSAAISTSRRNAPIASSGQSAALVRGGYRFAFALTRPQMSAIAHRPE